MAGCPSRCIPRGRSRGQMAVVDALDAADLSPTCVVPLVDAPVSVANLINMRLRRPANDPAGSALWPDQAMQQEALSSAGLAAAAHCATADVEEAVRFLAALGPGRRVVVKPRDSSGSDGVWLCGTDGAVRRAFAHELGRESQEWGTNSTLVVMEALIGEERIEYGRPGRRA